MRKLVIIISILLFVSSCSTLMPFEVKQSTSSYKTLLDTYDVTDASDLTTASANNISVETKHFSDGIDNTLTDMPIDENSNKIKKLKDKLVISVDNNIRDIKQAQLVIVERIESVERRNQPTFEMKWFWWVILVVVATFLIGGVPALVLLFKSIRTIGKSVGGLADATYEVMIADEKIDNARIPKSLKKDK